MICNYTSKTRRALLGFHCTIPAVEVGRILQQLPEDTVILMAGYDQQMDALLLTVESKKFSEFTAGNTHMTVRYDYHKGELKHLLDEKECRPIAVT